MRVLLTAYPLHGHVNAMLPLARAARVAGHEVAFATGPDMAGHLAAHGLDAWAAGRSPGWPGLSAPPRKSRGVSRLHRIARLRPRPRR